MNTPALTGKHCFRLADVVRTVQVVSEPSRPRSMRTNHKICRPAAQAKRTITVENSPGTRKPKLLFL